MPKNSALLYPNRKPKNKSSPRYLGVLRLDDGRKFWAGLWRRTTNGETVVELRLEPKT
jgi:hypothetical protein